MNQLVLFDATPDHAAMASLRALPPLGAKPGRELPRGWKPSGRAIQLLRGRGKSPEQILVLVERYPAAMRTQRRGRWTDATFLEWCAAQR